MAVKKVLFYIAGQVPTTTEAAQIARLAMDANISLGVRSLLAVDVDASAGVQRTLEACDGVAGSYPTSGGSFVNNYTSQLGTTVIDYSAEAAGAGRSLSVFAPAGLAISGTGTKQLAAISEAPDGTLTDVTTTATWSSGTTGHATVGAATGLVTGVAAGTSVITASYVQNGKTITATATVTVS